MNRRLLFVLAAAALTTGCATQHPPEAEGLTSNIFGAAAQKLVCVAGDVPHCQSAGSRIHGLNQDLRCECTPQSLLTHPASLR